MQIDTSRAPDELIARVLIGPHLHWATFDEGLEGARFQALHDLVVQPSFDVAQARTLVSELEAFAQSYGYGCADRYFNDVSGMTDDEIEADDLKSIARASLFDSLDEDQYFVEVTQSEGTLRAAAATPEAREFLEFDLIGGFLHSRMLTAMEKGRDMRAAKEVASTTSPSP